VKGLRPAKEIFADPLAKWVPVFLGLMFISMLHATVTLYAWAATKLVLGHTMIFWMIARIATTQARLHGIFVALLLAHLFLLAMNPAVIMNPDVRNYIAGATFLGDGNDFALSLCIMVPLTVQLAMSAGGVFKKGLAWFAVLMLLFAIVASQSRGATIGLAAVLGFIWLFSPRKGLSLLGVLLAGVVVVLYAPPQYFSRLGTIVNYQSEGSASARIVAWKAATRMALDNPILGVGAGQFPSEFSGKYHPKDEPSGHWMTAHSSYFLIFGELGFPGLILVLILVVGNVRANLKVRAAIQARAGPDPARAAEDAMRMLFLTAGGMIGFAAAGAFLSAVYYPHIFVMSAILISVRSNALTAMRISLTDVFPDKHARRRRKAPSSETSEVRP
jgi:probable O-glycosylation ligase (exosortase A-associated)